LTRTPNANAQARSQAKIIPKKIACFFIGPGPDPRIKAITHKIFTVRGGRKVWFSAFPAPAGQLVAEHGCVASSLVKQSRLTTDNSVSIQENFGKKLFTRNLTTGTQRHRDKHQIPSSIRLRPTMARQGGAPKSKFQLNAEAEIATQKTQRYKKGLLNRETR
jgi:hypothetical protein